MTVKELKAMAKELKVKNWWTLKKAELIASIEAAQKESEGVAANESITETEEPKNNGWELIAKKQLKNAYNWIVGGNENAVSDVKMTNEEFKDWLRNEALNEVYHEAITTKYDDCYTGGNAPSEMRFAGKKFCYEYLKRLFKNDGYKIDEPTSKEEKKQKSKDLIEYNGKTQNLSQWAKELGMRGQTLFARIHISGWTVEKAFTTPVKIRKKEEEA